MKDIPEVKESTLKERKKKQSYEPPYTDKPKHKPYTREHLNWHALIEEYDYDER